jgi:thioredoxin reductase (NADPH)
VSHESNRWERDSNDRMSDSIKPPPRADDAPAPELPTKFDVIIIGGGPAGASAGIYTSRADLSTLVIDKGLTVGALGVTGKISNYPGVPGPVTGAELLAIMRSQAESFGARFITDRVVGLDISGEQRTVFTNGGSYEARAVVVATGSMGRAATAPGEDRLLGRGVSYCATCDGAFFRGQPVAVVGNNDEALEEALFLTKFASEVHLLVQTSRFKASESLVSVIEAVPNVQVHFATRLVSIAGDEAVTGVRVATRDGAEQDLSVNGVFVYLQGSRPITEYLMGQLDTNPEGCLKVDAQMQTSVPGVFAVGDLLCTHVKQAVIAAADGVVAAVSTEKYLNHRSKTKVDWA